MAGLEHPRRRHISATPEDDAQSRTGTAPAVESIASLRRVAQFVDLWHGLDTGLEQLPPLLNAELCRRSGGRLILGFAIVFGPVCQVVINHESIRPCWRSPSSRMSVLIFSSASGASGCAAASCAPLTKNVAPGMGPPYSPCRRLESRRCSQARSERDTSRTSATFPLNLWICVAPCGSI